MRSVVFQAAAWLLVSWGSCERVKATHRFPSVIVYIRQKLSDSQHGPTLLRSSLWRRMPQRKMLQCSTGALLLFLPWIGGLAFGEVDRDFSNCLYFFYRKSPPTGATGYQPICQRYKDQYHFASLYNREHRVPLYSAYILRTADGKRPNATWMYEPQVSTFL